MLTFKMLRNANSGRNKEWDPQGKIDAAFRGLEFAGEAGELCNIVKKMIRQEAGLVGSKVTIEQLAEELADVVICADLIAMHFNVDLAKAVCDKFNQSSLKYSFATMIEPEVEPPMIRRHRQGDGCYW
jgi:NTP pyrophosphatase (non-canonical NTP hydrolase)